MSDVYRDDDQYREVIEIEYDADENSFYDQCGIHIINIFEMLTPSNLLLFRKNPQKFYEFPHRDNKQVLCKLIMNGVYNDEQDYNLMPWELCCWGNCQFFDNEGTSQAEICYLCGGRNC